MKDWFLHSKLFHWAYRQGGIDSFYLAQKDILDSMQDDLDKQASILAKEKLEALLVGINTDLIVKLDTRNGVVFIGKERPDDARLATLKSEAEFFEQSELWKILHETPKALAHKAMFNDDGTLENQLIKGRAILYTLDTQKRVIDVFKSFSKLSTAQ